MRWRILLLLLSTFLSNEACSREDVPEPPKCSGFRNQCIAEASLGAQFGCALLHDRSVWCWGRNDQGQLGYPTTEVCPIDVGGGKTRAIACHTSPARVNDLTDVDAVRSGDAFSCAVLSSGGVRCWGANSYGQLGNGKTITSQAPTDVQTLSGVATLAVGHRHACALTAGSVVCWGSNAHGQLGRVDAGTCGENIPCATRPVPVEGDLGDVVALSAGANHTCALSRDGRVTCWGDNRWGQLGVGSSGAPMPESGDDDAGVGDADVGDAMSPPKRRSVHVTSSDPLTWIVAISAGGDHTCALRDGGDVYCWGRDDHHELGGPPPSAMADVCEGPCSDLAVKVANLPAVVEPDPDAGTDAGADASAEAGTDVGADSGADSGADVGTDAGADAHHAETGVFGRMLASGHSYTCLRVGDGTVRCWGSDTVGQLGDGRSTSEPTGPTLVIAAPGAAPNNPLQGVKTIAAGAWSACAMMSDSSLKCWGENQSGALGVGHYTPQQGPVPVSW